MAQVGERGFWVARPSDEYGNTSYTPAVIEGEIIERLGGFTSIKVIAPPEFRDKWPTVSEDFFMETEGPARMLTRDEWKDVVGWSDPTSPR